VGGEDESMRFGYEDWEFWLRLGAANRFGRRLPKPLFHYRKRTGSLSDTALVHHAENVAYIESRHPELYGERHRARLKAHLGSGGAFRRDASGGTADHRGHLL
jgi:hypothetical protein